MADYATLDQLVGRPAIAEVVADPDANPPVLGVTYQSALAGYLEKTTDAGKRNQIAEIITRRSRGIDAYVTGGKMVDFFAPAVEGSAGLTTRIIRGNGTNSLPLPPHVGTISATDVTAPEQFTVSTFVDTSNELLAVETDGTPRMARTARTVGTVQITSDYHSSYGFWSDDYSVSYDATYAFPLGVPFAITARWGFAANSIEIAEINEACIEWVVRTVRGQDEAFSGKVGSIQRDGTILERGMPLAVKEILDRYVGKYVAFEPAVEALINPTPEPVI